MMAYSTAHVSTAEVAYLTVNRTTVFVQAQARGTFGRAGKSTGSGQKQGGSHGEGKVQNDAGD